MQTFRHSVKPRFSTFNLAGQDGGNFYGGLKVVGNTSLSCRHSPWGPRKDKNSPYQPRPAMCNRAADAQDRNVFDNQGREWLDNNDFYMWFVDVDDNNHRSNPNEGAPGGANDTFNSSQADLTLPTGAEVVWAGLYWAGDLEPSRFDPWDQLKDPVNWKEGVAKPRVDGRDWTPRDVWFQALGKKHQHYYAKRCLPYDPQTPNPSDCNSDIKYLWENGDGTDASGDYTLAGKRYQAYANVTDYVKATATPGGTTTYRTMNVASGFGHYAHAGWYLAVVYEKPPAPGEYPRTISVYDFLYEIGMYDNSDPKVGNPRYRQRLIVDAGHFTTPGSLKSTGLVTMAAWDGDRGEGNRGTPRNRYDRFKLHSIRVNGAMKQVAGGNLGTGEGGRNPNNNFFNSTIVDKNRWVTDRKPNDRNNFGIDIDTINLNDRLPEGTTGARFAFESFAGEQFIPAFFAFDFATEPCPENHKPCVGPPNASIEFDPQTPLTVNEPSKQLVLITTDGLSDYQSLFPFESTLYHFTPQMQFSSPNVATAYEPYGPNFVLYDSQSDGVARRLTAAPWAPPTSQGQSAFVPRMASLSKALYTSAKAQASDVVNVDTTYGITWLQPTLNNPCAFELDPAEQENAPWPPSPEECAPASNASGPTDIFNAWDDQLWATVRWEARWADGVKDLNQRWDKIGRVDDLLLRCPDIFLAPKEANYCPNSNGFWPLRSETLNRSEQHAQGEVVVKDSDGKGSVRISLETNRPGRVSSGALYKRGSETPLDNRAANGLRNSRSGNLELNYCEMGIPDGASVVMIGAADEKITKNNDQYKHWLGDDDCAGYALKWQWEHSDESCNADEGGQRPRRQDYPVPPDTDRGYGYYHDPAYGGQRRAWNPNKFKGAPYLGKRPGWHNGDGNVQKCTEVVRQREVTFHNHVNHNAHKIVAGEHEHVKSGPNRGKHRRIRWVNREVQGFYTKGRWVVAQEPEAGFGHNNSGPPVDNGVWFAGFTFSWPSAAAAQEELRANGGVYDANGAKKFNCPAIWGAGARPGTCWKMTGSYDGYSNLRWLYQQFQDYTDPVFIQVYGPRSSR